MSDKMVKCKLFGIIFLGGILLRVLCSAGVSDFFRLIIRSTATDSSDGRREKRRND